LEPGILTKEKKMNKCEKLLLFLITILVFAITLMGEKNNVFKLIDKWNHESETFGRIFWTTIDKDNNIISVFYKIGPTMITPTKVTSFAPRGEGPNDLMDIKTFFLYGEDLAFVEFQNKIKIFKKVNDTYAWKKTLWLKSGKFPHIISGGIFFKTKFFFAGFNYLEMTAKKEVVSLIKVIDENGKPLKNLIKREFLEVTRQYDMDYYIIDFQKNLYFMAENELKLIIIDPETLEVKKEIPLETPSFYKKMPDDFYAFKKYHEPDDYRKDVEYWKSSYSRITKFINEGDYFVISLRTCSNQLKKFALLFYNGHNFKLEKTIFIDDFLLDARQGKYYFFANGNPGQDEDTDKCLINIYAFKEKNDEK
jgi:hypothetical protein